MPSPPLRVFLSKQEEEMLFKLSKDERVSQRTRARASALRLSSLGWKVSKIAIYLKWSIWTVRETIHRWNKQGLEGLWDAARSGRNRKWSREALEEIEQKLDQEERSYSSRQLCQYLATERKIKLSERHLRRILKKKTIGGKEQENL